jgi:hypothetical protein
MKFRIALIVLALAAAGCDRQASTSGGSDAPQLDAPAPENEPARQFSAANDGARAAAGELSVSVSLRLPDAGNADGDAQEVLTLRGGNGLIVETEIAGSVSPATQVGGQTLRALLSIPVEEPQVLVYRVVNETKPDGGGGICGAETPAFLVVWEPAGPGEPVMKLLGLTGGQPGAASSRACTMLEYRRG